MTFRITSITAYTQIGPDDEEGIIAFLNDDGAWMPMIAADPARLDQLRMFAQVTADISGRPVTVRQFGIGEVLDTIEPRPDPPEALANGLQ